MGKGGKMLENEELECIFCGSPDSLFCLHEKYICAECIIELIQKIVLNVEPDIPGI